MAFPRVADMVTDMEKKRDAAEVQERKFILELESRLLMAENEMVKDALSALHG